MFKNPFDTGLLTLGECIFAATRGEFFEFDLELHTLFLPDDLLEFDIDFNDYLGENKFAFWLLLVLVVFLVI